MSSLWIRISKMTKPPYTHLLIIRHFKNIPLPHPPVVSGLANYNQKCPDYTEGYF